MNQERIIGFMVHKSNSDHDIETAALYGLSQREDAFDAAKRWGACVTPLVQSAASPKIDGVLGVVCWSEIKI